MKDVRKKTGSFYSFAALFFCLVLWHGVVGAAERQDTVAQNMNAQMHLVQFEISASIQYPAFCVPASVFGSQYNDNIKGLALGEEQAKQWVIVLYEVQYDEEGNPVKVPIMTRIGTGKTQKRL